MYKASPSLDVIHYADDTTACICGNNINELLTAINNILGLFVGPNKNV